MKRQIAAFSLVEVVVIAAIVVALTMLVLNHACVTPRLSYEELSRYGLEDIGSALSEYHDEHAVLPPAHTVDAEGTRLHSWRTLLLPYLGQQELFDLIDLTKPWNDPANEYARDCFAWPYCSYREDTEEGMTTYLAVISSVGVFDGAKPRTDDETSGKAKDELAVIDVDTRHAVHWMCPQDIDVRDAIEVPREGDDDTASYNVLFADGSVGELSAELLAQKLAAMAVDVGHEAADASEADQASPEGAKP